MRDVKSNRELKKDLSNEYTTKRIESIYPDLLQQINNGSYMFICIRSRPSSISIGFNDNPIISVNDKDDEDKDLSQVLPKIERPITDMPEIQKSIKFGRGELQPNLKRQLTTSPAFAYRQNLITLANKKYNIPRPISMRLTNINLTEIIDMASIIDEQDRTFENPAFLEVLKQANSLIGSTNTLSKKEKVALLKKRMKTFKLRKDEKSYNILLDLMNNLIDSKVIDKYSIEYFLSKEGINNYFDTDI